MPTDDPWPDEPDEVDPEARWGNPERDLVERISIPEHDEPDPESEFPTEAVSGELSRLFWASVLLVNAAVFALSLGPMLIYFRGQWLLGLGLVGGGVLALGRTYGLYQQYKQEAAEQSGGDDSETADGSLSVEADAVETTADKDGDDGGTEPNPASPERNP